MRADEFIVTRSIKEDIVSDTASYSQELNPKVWNDREIDPQVRQRLLEIAELFVEYLNVPGFDIEDIVLTGSMCNFNYTKFSDFDVHVVTDYSRLECDDIAEEFYRAKKDLWNDRHDITIYGHDVELYVEDSADPPVSSGIYSLLHDKWIKEPQYDPPTIDSQAVSAKVDDIIRDIRTAIGDDATDADITRVRAKIRKMRQSGLAERGEFSVENLAFKALRNKGLLDLLSKIQIRKQDDKLSINETLKKVKGKWALVSKSTGRPLQYYHGSGHPSKEWVNKVERRVHSFGENQDFALV